MNHLATLDASYFPEKLRPQFEAIQNAVASGDKSIEQSVQAMTEETACEIARKIYTLEDDLRSWLDDRR